VVQVGPFPSGLPGAARAAGHSAFVNHRPLGSCGLGWDHNTSSRGRRWLGDLEGAAIGDPDAVGRPWIHLLYEAAGQDNDLSLELPGLGLQGGWFQHNLLCAGRHLCGIYILSLFCFNLSKMWAHYI